MGRGRWYLAQCHCLLEASVPLLRKRTTEQSSRHKTLSLAAVHTHTHTHTHHGLMCSRALLTLFCFDKWIYFVFEAFKPFMCLTGAEQPIVSNQWLRLHVTQEIQIMQQCLENSPACKHLSPTMIGLEESD